MNVSAGPVNSLDASIQLSEYKSDLQNRLDGWKEISLYLKRSVRCVQRWEKNERLPVHRHKHLQGMTVYAFRHELDSWWHDQRQASTSPEKPASVDVLGQGIAPAIPNSPDESPRGPKSLSLATFLSIFRQLTAAPPARTSADNLQPAKRSGRHFYFSGPL